MDYKNGHLSKEYANDFYLYSVKLEDTQSQRRAVLTYRTEGGFGLLASPECGSRRSQRPGENERDEGILQEGEWDGGRQERGH